MKELKNLTKMTYGGYGENHTVFVEADKMIPLGGKVSWSMGQVWVKIDDPDFWYEVHSGYKRVRDESGKEYIVPLDAAFIEVFECEDFASGYKAINGYGFFASTAKPEFIFGDIMLEKSRW